MQNSNMKYNGKIKGRRETRSEWLIGVHTQNIPYLSIVTTQHNTRQRHLRRLLMRVKARIHDWKGAYR